MIREQLPKNSAQNLIEDSLNLAMNSQNSLLLNYIRFWDGLNGKDVSLVLEQNFDNQLKWFDTLPIGFNGEETESELVEKKIAKTVNAITNLENNGLLICIIAPALDEAANISMFLKSISEQKTDYPVIVVISDNGSTDATPVIAGQLGANVSIAPTKGVGPARQNGLETVKTGSKIDNKRVIIVQTDSDGFLANANYLQSVGQAYEHNESLMVSVGPTQYPLVQAEGNSSVIKGGVDFRNCFGSLSLKKLFAECGRDINDYLLMPPYRLLAGANTTYRLSVFEDNKIAYPADKSWESVVISVRLQQIIKPDQIAYLDDQEVLTSNRSYADERGITSSAILELIRLKRYIAPHKSPDSISPAETLKNLLWQLDRETYSLNDDEIVIAAGDDRLKSVLTKSQRLVQAKHAATGKTLPGKYVVIGKRYAE